jgi:hypothetical protein
VPIVSSGLPEPVPLVSVIIPTRDHADHPEQCGTRRRGRPKANFFYRLTMNMNVIKPGCLPEMVLQALRPDVGTMTSRNFLN